MGKKKRKKNKVQLPSDYELLQELATLDVVEAYIPTNVDHDAQAVPPWCELMLEVKREAAADAGPGSWPIHTRWYLRRHDGELIIQALHEVLHPDANGTTVGMLWAELDEVVDRIQRRVQRGREPFKVDIGQAQGLNRAIAILTNPHSYDEDAVREEAMERWEARQPH